MLRVNAAVALTRRLPYVATGIELREREKKKDRDPHLSVYYIRIHREPFFLHQIFYGCLLIRNIVDSLVKHEISHVVTGLSTGFPFPVSMRWCAS